MLAVAPMLLGLALQFIPPTLGTNEYVSPSHKWTLTVRPSVRTGAGPSHVSAAHDGEKAWEKDFSFTLWDAVIDDLGSIAGYAYTQGYGETEEPGELVLVVLSDQGIVLSRAAVKRHSRSIDDSPPSPLALGVFEQTERGIFVMRVSDDAREPHEDWWVFKKSTGEQIAVVQPKAELERPEVVRRSLGVAQVRGSPLTIAQWYCMDIDGNTVGARFVLHDDKWKPIWSLDLPNDYAASVDTKLQWEMQTHGAILKADTDRRFELRLVAENVRVTYEVSADKQSATGWTVRELARAPYSVAAKK